MAMHVEVFRHRTDPAFEQEYEELYSRLAVVIAGLKGYISHKSFTAEDGEKVLIGYFEDFESVEEWDRHPEHKYAKERGKEDVFWEYDVVVGEVVEHHSKTFVPPEGRTQK